MKRIFTLLLSVFAVTLAMGQAPDGVFAKASVDPVVDGVVDAEWAKATAYNIERAVGTQTPTIGTPGETTWQGLWAKDGVYILLLVTDDHFYPNYEAGTGTGFEDYNYDKLEVYFDVNLLLEDDLGPSGKKGHYQVAPGFKVDKIDGSLVTETNGVKHAIKVDGSHYTAEYYVPYTMLLDNAGAQVDKTNTIGFDVTVIDRDPGDAARNQAVWSNEGVNGESWTNMNDAGHVTFEDAEAPVYVSDITLTGGTITTDNGTLQMVATVLPEDASIKTVKWTVDNTTGNATIDANGLLKGIENGTVSVTATSMDGQGTSATVDVEISGQAISRGDIWNSFNLIKNWNFNTVDATNTITGLANWGGWRDGDGQLIAVLNEGAVGMTTAVYENATTQAIEQYHYQFSQDQLKAIPEVPYVVTFKSWADAERANTLDFEDIEANSYNRYGASSDAEAQDGRSEWHYTLTTEPQWFVFHVTFDEIIETTNQKMQWLQSQAAGTIYLDSVLVVTEETYNLLATLPNDPVSAKTIANSINKVYPNPVGDGNSLFVELSKANTKVAIYNAVGQKMMERVSNGKLAKFDVSSLRQGMYFIKLGDGSVQKFIR